MTLPLPTLVTSLLTVSLVALGGCTPYESKTELHIAAGVDGTYVVVGSDLQEGLWDLTKPADGTQGDAAAPVRGLVLAHSDTAGITVGAVSGGPEPVNKNASLVFTPASITKLVTTATALKTLGPQFKFTTQFLWRGTNTAENLTVVADGDPQVAANDPTAADQALRARLRDAAQEIRRRGVLRVDGSVNLISFDERRDSGITPEGLSPEDNISCYGAVSSSFNYQWNCATLGVNTVSSASWTDTALSFPFTLSLSTGSSSALKPTAVLNGEGRVTSFQVDGKFNSRRGRANLMLPVSQTKAWYGRAFLAELAKQGIDVSRAQIAIPIGAAANVAEAAARGAQGFSLESDPLSDIIRFQNKESDNFLADSVFKTFASRQGSGGADLRLVGASIVRDNVKNWMHAGGTSAYASEILLKDGAGLSHDNRVSPRAYLALLKQFSKEPTFQYLWESLPIAGVDGTLKTRMVGTRAAGVVRAKTGTLKGAYQLAGYIPKLDSNGTPIEFIPFVILSEATPQTKDQVYAFQQQIVVRLMEVINPP